MPDETDVRDAIHELHEYFSDRLPPLMVLDAMQLLLQAPASLLADEIGAWAVHQRADVTASDLLYHGVKKIWALGDLNLLDREALGRCLRELSAGVLALCPQAEQEGLRDSLNELGQGGRGVIPAPAGVIHRQHPDEQRTEVAGEALPGMAGVSVGLRRLALFLERLRSLAVPAFPPTPGVAAFGSEQRSALASQFMVTATAESRDQRELESRLAPLRQLGIATDTGHLMRSLASTLAGWGALPESAQGVRARPAELEAMRHIVSIAGPLEAGARMRELVVAAIEQFNQGHLGRAAAMFDLAEKLAAERRVPPASLVPLRESGAERLSAERLASYAERQDCRPSLRKVLDFFVALRPQGLLQALDGERSRDRRRQLLALAEAHGAPARAAATEMLRAHVEGRLPLDPYAPRNLVYLLQTIPRPEEVPVEDEVLLVMRAPGSSTPLPTVKQVIAYLSATRHEKAERALVTFLRVFETMLLDPAKASYTGPEIEALLDRTCLALARYGTPRAWRALVDHGLSAETRMGATLARLAEAGASQDLSSSPEIVRRLLEALQAELPKKVLGLTLRRNDERVGFLIRALSGTPAPAVMEALAIVAERYPGQKIAEEALRAMAALRTAARGTEPPALAGDLDLFGLPDVLQTLAGSRQSGVMTLMSVHGTVVATILFEAGRFRGARHRGIIGEEAVFQLIERPFRGSFAFVARQEFPPLVPLSPATDFVPLILEGARRHDELRQATALVPDGAALAVCRQPVALQDEDAGFAAQLWQSVQSGWSAERCESAWATDSYRVRRVLAHWVEQGVLKVKSPTPALQEAQAS